MDFPIYFWLFECISSMFCLRHFCIIGWCLVRQIHRLGLDLIIYSLERNTRLWLDGWQSLQTLPKLSLWLHLRTRLSRFSKCTPHLLHGDPSAEAAWDSWPRPSPSPCCNRIRFFLSFLNRSVPRAEVTGKKLETSTTFLDVWKWVDEM